MVISLLLFTCPRGYIFLDIMENCQDIRLRPKRPTIHKTLCLLCVFGLVTGILLIYCSSTHIITQIPPANVHTAEEDDEKNSMKGTSAKTNVLPNSELIFNRHARIKSSIATTCRNNAELIQTDSTSTIKMAFVLDWHHKLGYCEIPKVGAR